MTIKTFCLFVIYRFYTHPCLLKTFLSMLLILPGCPYSICVASQIVNFNKLLFLKFNHCHPIHSYRHPPVQRFLTDTLDHSPCNNHSCNTSYTYVHQAMER